MGKKGGKKRRKGRRKKKRKWGQQKNKGDLFIVLLARGQVQKGPLGRLKRRGAKSGLHRENIEEENRKKVVKGR